MIIKGIPENTTETTNNHQFSIHQNKFKHAKQSEKYFEYNFTLITTKTCSASNSGHHFIVGKIMFMKLIGVKTCCDH